jgi:organic radical activating enzyme
MLDEPKQQKLRVILHVVDHCNLNCRGCCTFSPLAEKSCLSVKTIRRDCQNLIKVTEPNVEIAEVAIMGGEPLLHPQLPEIFFEARKFFVNSLVFVVTNGLLLMEQPLKFWQSCKRNKIKIRITKYPLNIDFAAREQLAARHRVSLDYFNNTNIKNKTFGKMPLDINGQQSMTNFTRCYYHSKKPCLILKSGKGYACMTTPNITHFNKYFGYVLQTHKSDYLLLAQLKTAKQIFTFLRAPKHFCKYCQADKLINDGLKWAFSKKDILEWI